MGGGRELGVVSGCFCCLGGGGRERLRLLLLDGRWYRTRGSVRLLGGDREQRVYILRLLLFRWEVVENYGQLVILPESSYCFQSVYDEGLWLFSGIGWLSPLKQRDSIIEGLRSRVG